MQQNKIDTCPFQEAMDLMSGKWTMTIINTLMAGKMRFKVLERSIPGINTRMLVKELKQLEKTGVLTRTAYATIPPTVEYALSEKGISLTSVLAAVQDWALKNMQTKN